MGYRYNDIHTLIHIHMYIHRERERTNFKMIYYGSKPNGPLLFTPTTGQDLWMFFLPKYGIIVLTHPQLAIIPSKKNTKMTVLRKKVMIHHRNFRVPFSQTKMRWSQVRHQLSYLWLITPFTEQLIRGMKLRAFLCCLFLQNSYLMHLCKLWVITSLPIIGLPWLLWHSARPCWRIYCWFLSFLAMPKKKP